MEIMAYLNNITKMLKALLINSLFHFFLSSCSPEREEMNQKNTNEKIEFGAGDDFSGPWQE
jgi:hypothetical protein